MLSPDQNNAPEKRSIWRRTRRIAPPIIAVVLIAFLAVVLYNLLFPAYVPPGKKEFDKSVKQVMASVKPPPPYSTRVHRAILPSLVFIQTQQDNDQEKKFGPGTGVVVNKNGDILTAFHVVADAVEIKIHFSDGSQSTAQILSAEPKNDIAVLRPDQPPGWIFPAILGNPGAMRVGDEAYVVGNPLGLVASMSAGVNRLLILSYCRLDSGTSR